MFRIEVPPRLGVLLAFTLNPPEDDAQLAVLCGTAPVFGKESAMFPMEKEVLLGVGLAFLRGTLVAEDLEPWPKAELTKSPKRLGFLLTIPMLLLEAEEG